MKKDYREYSAIKDILKILNINPNFVLLTNNPDKVDAMNSLNINSLFLIKSCPYAFLK